MSVHEAVSEGDKQSACCGAHSLAEVYSNLTRMPGRISGDHAMLLVSEIRDRLSIVALDADEYVLMLEKAAAAGITGVSIYDAILAACALRTDAAAIYTWNIRHYSLLGPEVASWLR